GLVPLALGSAFSGAVGPLRVLALGLPAVFMNSVLLHALIAAGRASWLPWLTARRLAVAALLAPGLIVLFGAWGAATGFVASELVRLALASRACRKAQFPVPVARPLALGLAAALPMAAAVALVGGGALSGAALGACIYGATLLLAWRFTPRLERLVGD